MKQCIVPDCDNEAQDPVNPRYATCWLHEGAKVSDIIRKNKTQQLERKLPMRHGSRGK